METTFPVILETTFPVEPDTTVKEKVTTAHAEPDTTVKEKVTTAHAELENPQDTSRQTTFPAESDTPVENFKIRQKTTKSEDCSAEAGRQTIFNWAKDKKDDNVTIHKNQTRHPTPFCQNKDLSSHPNPPSKNKDLAKLPTPPCKDGGNPTPSRLDGGHSTHSRLDGGHPKSSRLDGGHSTHSRLDGGYPKSSHLNDGHQQRVHPSSAKDEATDSESHLKRKNDKRMSSSPQLDSHLPSNNQQLEDSSHTSRSLHLDDSQMNWNKGSTIGQTLGVQRDMWNRSKMQDTKQQLSKSSHNELENMWTERSKSTSGQQLVSSCTETKHEMKQIEKYSSQTNIEPVSMKWIAKEVDKNSGRNGPVNEDLDVRSQSLKREDIIQIGRRNEENRSNYSTSSYQEKEINTSEVRKDTGGRSLTSDIVSANILENPTVKDNSLAEITVSSDKYKPFAGRVENRRSISPARTRLEDSSQPYTPPRTKLETSTSNNSVSIISSKIPERQFRPAWLLEKDNEGDQSKIYRDTISSQQMGSKNGLERGHQSQLSSLFPINREHKGTPKDESVDKKSSNSLINHSTGSDGMSRVRGGLAISGSTVMKEDQKSSLFQKSEPLMSHKSDPPMSHKSDPPESHKLDPTMSHKSEAPPIFKSGFLLRNNEKAKKMVAKVQGSAIQDMSKDTSSDTSNMQYTKSITSRLENNNYLDNDKSNAMKSELDEITKQKAQIQDKLQALGNDNLLRLLHISPSPEEFTLTDKLYLLENEVKDLETLSPQDNSQRGEEILASIYKSYGSKSTKADLSHKDMYGSNKDVYNSTNTNTYNNKEDNRNDNMFFANRKRSNDSAGSADSNTSSRYRHRSGPASPEDTSLHSEKSFDSDEDRSRQRRKSGPASSAGPNGLPFDGAGLKPVLRSNLDLHNIKKSVTFSSPKTSSIDQEVYVQDMINKFERRNTMEEIPIKKAINIAAKNHHQQPVKMDIKALAKESYDGSNDKWKSPQIPANRSEADEQNLDTKSELEEIIKQKEEIEIKLAEMNSKNLQRLLHVSPSPEALPETEKMELMIGPSGYQQDQLVSAGHMNPNLRVMRGPIRPRFPRPRSPYPPQMMQAKLMLGPRMNPPQWAPSMSTGQWAPPPTGPTRMSPPLRGMPMHMFRSPSPTAGLIRVTPRHLPPSYRLHGPPRLRTPSPLYPRLAYPRMPVMSPRSPLRTLRCSGRFSPIRPPHFRPKYYMAGPRSPRPLPPSAVRFPAHHNTAASMTGHQGQPLLSQNMVAEKNQSGGKPNSKPVTDQPASRSTAQPVRANIKDVKHVTLQSSGETILQVRGYGTVKIKTPEVATISCSDLLSAYRLSQNLAGGRPYRYNENDSMDLHRRLTINSRKIFDKLSSPRKEKKGPYVPNREVLRLFRNDQRGRETLAMENEEMLYRHKTGDERQGEFFGPKNAEVLEKFQATHDYIRKMYIHSKSSLIPPADEFSDVHERVKYFCGVTNEELLEKLKGVEERVRNTEWFSRVQDTKEKMKSLYDENREFLAKYKQQHEQKVNDLLEENKELITNFKEKVNTIDRNVKENFDSLDRMVEQAVIEVI